MKYEKEKKKKKNESVSLFPLHSLIINPNQIVQNKSLIQIIIKFFIISIIIFNNRNSILPPHLIPLFSFLKKNRKSDEIPSNWSEARKKAYMRKDRNPNSYYFRFNDPSEENKTGPWSQVY